MIYNALVQRGGDTRGQVRANHLQPRDRADPESDSERGPGRIDLHMDCFREKVSTAQWVTMVSAHRPALSPKMQ